VTLRRLGAALACFVASQGCAELLLRSQWGGPPPPIVALENQGDSDGIVIDARNDADFLYLTLSTAAESIKSQILGAFLQHFTIWFDPKGRDQPENGLRIAFHRLPGVGFPASASEQKEYLRTSTREVSLIRGGLRGKERILQDDGKEFGLTTEMDDGRLFIRVKLPLQAQGTKGWGIGGLPGERVGLILECSGIDPSIAQVELTREYEEQYLGWGFGVGSNAFGPKEGLWPPKGTGLGSYDAAGLDKSIYATHGVYRPLSWASVPQPLDLHTKLRLADEP
jgi:hypothetical protein